MSEYEDLVAKILEQKADLNRESLNKEKKATVGKGYLQDKLDIIQPNVIKHRLLETIFS